ncbi:MAG: pantoate--beta-alanine ligase [Candidatus Gastranaerophilales bacterium]|nr:pantoate--beta-alanine ligase [Candidatus Gastranaerophilales bacterium]
MKIIDNIAELKKEIALLNGSVGLVPTMGALHNGHKSLINKSVSENKNTIVSIFVNPIQFGANEDLDKYPRQLQEDAKLCESAGVNIIFAPKVSEMYGDDKNNLTLICPPYFAVDKLCGKSRPGHFDGVCSVVAKLFNLTKANKAYFGQKDAQQLFIIQKMVRDLNFDIEIIPCPIVREFDNLALSSRNQYLSTKDRADALNISKALFNAKKMVGEGIKQTRAIIDASLKIMENLDVEYIEFVDKYTFEFQQEVNENTIMLIAARVQDSNTRLIDNINL